MNKTIWAIAFVVLACGVSFAIGNATVDEGTQSKWGGPATAESYTTEGGNVTDLNLTGNASTEKWAGIYGDVSGTLVLTEENEATYYMYDWTWNATAGGTVCASTASTPTWVGVAAALVAGLDSAWGFTTGDADSATNTMTESGIVDIDGTATPSSAAVTTVGTAGWQTVALDVGTAGTKNGYAFCVNISDATDNFKAVDVDFEMMVPTNNTALSTETYYFFVELG